MLAFSEAPETVEGEVDDLHTGNEEYRPEAPFKAWDAGANDQATLPPRLKSMPGTLIGRDGLG